MTFWLYNDKVEHLEDELRYAKERINQLVEQSASLRLILEDREKYIREMSSRREILIHKGEYCKACKNHIMIKDDHQDCLVCAYGQCQHFEQEK